MSFLNPVSEPVLRFKSTDEGAPQINYNSRTAGDVKAVLKACLVTGYGTTASAGWSVVNEAGNVAEFVSPSAAMSDYRLGIDDSSTANTTWYYQYQGVRVNPSNNAPTKNILNVDKTHTTNGWQLLVSNRGFVFIELFYSTAVNKLSARITYFSQIKSALAVNTGKNIMFFNIGHDAAIGYNSYLYKTANPYFALASYNEAQVFGSTVESLGVQGKTLDVSSVNIKSPLYIADGSKKLFLGQVTGMLGVTVNKADEMYGAIDEVVDGRPVLTVTAGYSRSSASLAIDSGSLFSFYLDYWEY